jgi:Zn-dependent oligopeptidase
MKTIYQLLFLILIGCQACTTYDTKSVENNPLLNEFNTPYETLPFNEINPEHMMPNAEICFESKLNEMKRISKLSKTQKLGNVIFSFLIESNKLATLISYTNNVNRINNNNNNNKDIQEATQNTETKLMVGSAKNDFNRTIKTPAR